MFKIIQNNIENAKTAEVMSAILNYYWDMIYTRMIVYGEPINLACNNVIRELEHEQMEQPKIR